MNNNGINLSEEYRDLVRYFRLSMLRDRGMLPPEGLKELNEIVQRNERAQAIEASRKEHEEGRLSEENYRIVYDTHRAALAEAIKAASQKQEPVQVEKPQLSPEFADLARYFRLSILRNKGQLPPAGLEELATLVENNERAAAIEEARTHLLDGSIKPEDYERVVAFHRAALAEEIKKTFGGQKEQRPEPPVEVQGTTRSAEEDEKQVEPQTPKVDPNYDPKKDPNFVPDLYKEVFNRYEKELNRNNVNDYVKPYDKDTNIEPRYNDANKLKDPNINNNKIDQEKLNHIKEVVDKNLNNKVDPMRPEPPVDNKKLLSDLKKAIQDIQKPEEKITPQTTMFKEQQQNRVDIPDEFRSLARYFRLSILRNNGQLPPAGLKELDEIVQNNERAAAVEEAKRQMDNGNLSKENYQKVHDAQRAALAEAIVNAGPSQGMEQGRAR